MNISSKTRNDSNISKLTEGVLLMYKKRSGVAFGVISGMIVAGAVVGLLGNSKMMKRRRFMKNARNAINNVSGVVEKMTSF